MHGFKLLSTFVFVLFFIASSNTKVIIKNITENKYAGITPCDDDKDCEHLANSKCEDDICTCNGSKFCEDITRIVVTKVGQACFDDDDCNIENAECVDKKCRCKWGFVKSPNAKTCLMVSEGIDGNCEDSVQCYTKIANSGCRGNKCVCQQHMHVFNGSCYRNVDLGQRCNNNAECSFTEFAECKNSICTCIGKYVASSRGSRCLLMADGIQSPCVDDAQCRAQLGGNSDCNNGICECREMYQFKNTTKKCVRDILLGEICEVHSDCHGPYPGRSRLDCILGVCKCKIFYTELDGYCINASQKLKISMVVIIIFHIHVIVSVMGRFL